MNILITSIGQRGYLIDHFKENTPDVNVYAADATGYAPGLQNADKGFILPKANDENYFDELLKICKNNNIKGIISINDLELPILAKHKEKLQEFGINAIISSESIIDICFDKYKTYLFCKEMKIGVPRTYLYTERETIFKHIEEGKITFPIIAKPRKGSRSIGIHLIENFKQLSQEIEELNNSPLPEDEKIMFQEFIDSEQYSVHVFNNEKNEPIKVVGMVNIFKHFGETFHIKALRDTQLLELGVKIGKNLKHLGPLSADIHRRKNGEYVVLEFNPRLSGCYSLSHYAGANFTGKIIDLIENKEIEDDLYGFDESTIMLKQFVTQKISSKDIIK